MEMNPRLFNSALGAALALAGASLLWLLLTVPLETFLGRIMVDDAFYYLVPAQNFIEGRGTSLDGMNPSNGYHPLWMLFTIAGAALLPAELELYLLPALSGACFILGAALLAFKLFPRMHVFAKALLFALFCFNFHLFKIFLQGLENGLNFLLFAALLVFLQRRFTPPRKIRFSETAGFSAASWPC